MEGKYIKIGRWLMSGTGAKETMKWGDDICQTGF